LTLPEKRQEHRAGPPDQPAPEQPKPAGLVRDCTGSWQLRVLVVDDNATECQLTLRQLQESWPYARHLAAECAVDGSEALKKIRRRGYAFVVLDADLLPAGDRNLLETLRAAGLRAPVIVVSTRPRTAIACDLESLAAAFVNKRELNPTRFRSAMASAVVMAQRVFGVVRAHPVERANGDGIAAPAEEAKVVRQSPKLSVYPSRAARVSDEKASSRKPKTITNIFPLAYVA